MAEDSEGDDDPKDLFGDPLLPPRDRRGRRKLRFAEETYVRVEDLAGMGMSVADIADALRISVPTLKKYFFPELQRAEAKLRAEVFSAMAKKARSGNVAAAKFVTQQLELGRARAPLAKRKAAAAPAPEPAPPPEGGELPPPAEKLGKKEQQNRAAKSAHEGTEWGGLLKH